MTATANCLFSHILCGWSSFLIMRSVIIACDGKLYTVASEHMPYSQGLHWHILWLCPVTFGAPVILNFLGTNFVLLCALVAFILVQSMFPLTFLGTSTTLECCLVRRKLMHLLPTNVAVALIIAVFFQTSELYLCWLCNLEHPIALSSFSMHEIKFRCYGTAESHWSLLHWFT